LRCFFNGVAGGAVIIFFWVVINAMLGRYKDKPLEVPLPPEDEKQ
jgi:hypothetical protein